MFRSINYCIYLQAPVIIGLQNNLEIDPTTVDSDPYIAKFQVKDPSGDNVSCMINETNAVPEMFYLKLDDIGMITNNKKNSKVILQINKNYLLK